MYNIIFERDCFKIGKKVFREGDKVSFKWVYNEFFPDKNTYQGKGKIVREEKHTPKGHLSFYEAMLIAVDLEKKENIDTSKYRVSDVLWYISCIEKQEEFLRILGSWRHSILENGDVLILFRSIKRVQ